MSVIWPSYTSPTPSPAARLGRLLHYASFLPALFFVWLGWHELADREYPWIPPDRGFAFFCFAFALGIVIAGRGVRWVFAAE